MQLYDRWHTQCVVLKGSFMLPDQPYCGGGTYGSWRNNRTSHEQTTEQGQETEHELDRRAWQN